MNNGMFHIFFHDDVDGIISAALVLKYVVDGRMYTLRPVRSSQRGDKFNKIIEDADLDGNDICIIVDYQHHEMANLWIDHHYNKTLGDKPVIDPNKCYDPKAKSAAKIIYEHLTYNPLGRYLPIDPHMINMVDMIDSAGYESVEYIFSCLTPLMILKAHLEQMTITIDSLYCRIVEVICAADFDINEALLTLGIDQSAVAKLRKAALSIEKAMVINGPVAITEMNRLYAYPRYSEYYVRPDVKYAFRVVHLGGDRVQTDVGFNQWGNFTNGVHIGQMLGGFNYTISGGGHHDVGGSVITKDKLEQHIDDILTILNPEGEMADAEMEKVGVDIEVDPVETEATDMVKTGEAKDMNEARKKAVEEQEEDKTNDKGSTQ